MGLFKFVLSITALILCGPTSASGGSAFAPPGNHTVAPEPNPGPKYLKAEEGDEDRGRFSDLFKSKTTKRFEEKIKGVHMSDSAEAISLGANLPADLTARSVKWFFAGEKYKHWSKEISKQYKEPIAAEYWGLRNELGENRLAEVIELMLRSPSTLLRSMRLKKAQFNNWFNYKGTPKNVAADWTRKKDSLTSMDKNILMQYKVFYFVTKVFRRKPDPKPRSYDKIET